MAIDTAQKRFSMMNPSCPWRGPMVVADGGGVDEEEQISFLYYYGGLGWASAAAGGPINAGAIVVLLPGQAGAAGDRAVQTGHITLSVATPATSHTPHDLNVSLLKPPLPGGDFVFVSGVRTPAELEGKISEGVGAEWFEKIHVFPRSVVLDVVLSTLNVAMEVYNADRKLSHDWDAFTNNVDNGVSITDLPTFSFTMAPQHGDDLNLEITPNGPSQIAGTLDFQFDFPTDPTTISIPVSGDRIILFQFQPERPMTERLRFLTDVLEHLDGTEQRISLRKNPRQELEMNILLEDGPTRALFDFLMFEWQPRVFALPMWHEATRLTSAVLVGASTVNVEETTFRDFRVGSSAVIFDPENPTVFDALVILSKTPTSITFTSVTSNAYAEGISVYPMRQAIMSGRINGRRSPVNLQQMTVRMRVLDNDSDLADVTAFDSFGGKVLLDDLNLIEGSQSAGHVREVHGVDGGVGAFLQKSLWDRSKRTQSKGFLTKDPQELWEMRQLLHALRGRQTSFYLPTGYKDLELADTATSGSVLGTITNVGYDRYVQARQPNNIIRVELTDGTVFTRTIVDSDPIDLTTEQITIDSGWPQTFTAAQVERIDIFEKVRFTTDNVEIRHLKGDGEATIVIPTRTVVD